VSHELELLQARVRNPRHDGGRCHDANRGSASDDGRPVDQLEPCLAKRSPDGETEAGGYECHDQNTEVEHQKPEERMKPVERN
jgi:hypothetical protein